MGGLDEAVSVVEVQLLHRWPLPDEHAAADAASPRADDLNSSPMPLCSSMSRPDRKRLSTALRLGRLP